jgi:alpha-methylacyl-CoA racemase
MNGPLSGIRVVELAALGAVPHAAMMLGDAGADVLRIDRADEGDAAADIVELGRRRNAVTRGRRSIGVNLKHPEAAAFVLQLVQRAHVLLEGFRPGVAERLGIGPTQCFAAQPALVYGRLTGWGREGPLASFGGHDINYVALSGTLGGLGPADRPPPVPLNVIADFGGGSMQLAFGVVAALVEAFRTGRGQVVDAAMVDGAASLATYIHSMRASGSWVD